MSVNTNRAKLKKAKTSREYQLIQYDFEYPLYWDECTMMYPTYNRGTSKDNRKFWRKKKMRFEQRMYRTWKHTRKTQWKS